jgi:short subunit fatty acids transporter
MTNIAFGSAFPHRLLRYLKKTVTGKLIPIYQYFFTIVFCLILCKICLTLCKIFCFQMMPNSHDITALTHRVCHIFNKVCGQWSIACEMSALRIENAYYSLAIDYRIGWIMCDIFDREIVSKHFIQLRVRNKDHPISPYKRQCPMRLVFVFLKHL